MKTSAFLLNPMHSKKMIPTLTGKPIFINHQPVDLQNLKEQAEGYIVESFYNQLDGYAWAKMMVTDDNANEAIANGFKVSNSYIPVKEERPGEFHNVKYDTRIVDGKFTHMALVRNPRYEAADILTPAQFQDYQNAKQAELNALNNSKPDNKKGSSIMKFFKTKKEETTEIDKDTVVEMQNAKGETVSATVAEMQAAYEADQEAKAKAKEMENAKKVDETSTVEVNGKAISIADLKAAFLNAKAKKNDAGEVGDDVDENTNEGDEEEEEEEKEERRKGKFQKQSKPL